MYLLSPTIAWDWNTTNCIGFGNAYVLPMEMFRRVEHNSNADRCADDTYGWDLSVIIR